MQDLAAMRCIDLLPVRMSSSQENRENTKADFAIISDMLSATDTANATLKKAPVELAPLAPIAPKDLSATSGITRSETTQRKNKLTHFRRSKILHRMMSEPDLGSGKTTEDVARTVLKILQEDRLVYGTGDIDTLVKEYQNVQRRVHEGVREIIGGMNRADVENSIDQAIQSVTDETDGEADLHTARRARVEFAPTVQAPHGVTTLGNMNSVAYKQYVLDSLMTDTESALARSLRLVMLRFFTEGGATKSKADLMLKIGDVIEQSYDLDADLLTPPSEKEFS